MPEIRVAQVIEATTGGTRRHLVDLVTHLDRARFAVTVLCATRRDPAFVQDIARMRAAGAEVVPVPMCREIHPLRDLAAFVRLRGLLRRGRFDLVHTHSSKAGFVGRLAARSAGIRRIVHTAHVFPFMMDVSPRRRAFYLRLERMAARVTDCLICVSRQEREVAAENGLAAPDKLRVIENGIDVEEVRSAASAAAVTELRRKHGLVTGDLIVGAVGRLTAQKGYRDLVEAAAEVMKRVPAARVIVVGEGELKAQIEEASHRLGLGNRFMLVGGSQSVYSYLAMFDVFVLPSRWEGLPYSAMEAMALEKAVVGSAVGGVPELIADGETGLLVTPKDPGSLAQGIIRFLEDPALRARCGASARERVATRFNRSTMVARISDLYIEQAGRDQRS